MEIFKIEDMTYYYPRQKKAAIKDINLSVFEGEFILLLGKSGSGKSTLGRVFNRIVPEFYGGEIRGNIKSEVEVGMLFQDPEKQLVMDKVEREIAFGLENIGTEYEVMRKKVMETLSFLNMIGIKNQKTYELSGGQKQKVALGATLAMGNKLLILDEPTSQLDPATAEEILHILKRLNEELGYTIIIIEQRIDRCFHLADRILFMEEGCIKFDGVPKEFVNWSNLSGINFLPTISVFFKRLGNENLPITVKEGRKELKKINIPIDNTKSKIQSNSHIDTDNVIKIEKLEFVYENGNEALKGIDLRVYKGEVLGVMGENGSGKSTLLKNISQLLKPTKGKVAVKGEVGYLSQNPNDYLFNDTVYDELKFTLDNKGIKDYSIIEKVLTDLDILEYRDKNPRDLSGGERQRVALASILVMEPQILLMDEPTRGLDRDIKDKLGKIILDLKARGKTVLLVTHDVEFVGKYCDRACLVFDGTIVQVGSKYDVLDSGIFYSTQINKLFNGFNNRIITLQDALRLFDKSFTEGAS